MNSIAPGGQTRPHAIACGRVVVIHLGSLAVRVPGCDDSEQILDIDHSVIVDISIRVE